MIEIDSEVGNRCVCILSVTTIEITKSRSRANDIDLLHHVIYLNIGWENGGLLKFDNVINRLIIKRQCLFSALPLVVY